jgi:Bacterial dnaA protein helix-turn-helix
MMHQKDNVTPAVNASFGLSTMLQTGDRIPRAPRPANRNVAPDERVLRVPREAIEQAVVQVFGVGQEDLRRITRGRARVALARQVAMYLAHVVCGLTLTDTGRLFGRDRTTVAHACCVIEDRRDDPLFDRALDLLEWVVPAITTRFPARQHFSS